MAVTPPRILLDGRDRSAEIVLTNQSAAILEVSTGLGYSVQFSDSTGASGIRPAQTPEEESVRCDNWLRVFPARFTIPPNSSRTVRLMITPSEIPASGEYWGRLRLTGTPTTFESTMVIDSAAGIATQIRTAVQLDLPVVFRVGEVMTSVSLRRLALQRTTEGEIRAMVHTVRNGNAAYRGTMYGRLVSATGDTVARAEAQFTTEFEFWQALSFPKVSPGSYRLHVRAVATKKGSAMDVVIPSPTVETSYEIEITDSTAVVVPTR